MRSEPVCLTLIAARRLREELFDYLSEQRDLVSGFTASDGAGYGPTVRLHSTAEQVKGNADEVLVRIILERPDAAQLLARLKTAFAGTRLVYWIMPVIEFGVIDEVGL
ncbi:DUF3240 family protein [Rhodopseudomonas sp. P2A-2r]|uniref:DUF3240 family protein n=1 Tax=unclassified Rhodopseudomonas TaxID=2638247 RepID=UPI0022341985|nr:DUF3240 family protein [Rhodopseudomonas sp. P2A-2r]UZE46780.1 DUF3240 family protein [Rhodopseudomonas sp. P2A-2r]